MTTSKRKPDTYSQGEPVDIVLCKSTFDALKRAVEGRDGVEVLDFGRELNIKGVRFRSEMYSRAAHANFT